MNEATISSRRQPLWLAALGSLTLLFMSLPILIVVPMSFSSAQSLSFRRPVSRCAGMRHSSAMKCGRRLE